MSSVDLRSHVDQSDSHARFASRARSAVQRALRRPGAGAIVATLVLLLLLAGESGVFGGNGISVVNNGDEGRTWSATSYVPSTISASGSSYIVDSLHKSTGAAAHSPSAGTAAEVTDSSSRLLLKFVSFDFSRSNVHVSDLVAAEVLALGLVMMVAYRRRVAYLQVLVLAVVVVPIFSRWMNSLYSDGPALAGTAALLIAWIGTRDNDAHVLRRVSTWAAMTIAIGFVAFSNLSFVAIAVAGIVAQVVAVTRGVFARDRDLDTNAGLLPAPIAIAGDTSAGSRAAYTELLTRAGLCAMSVVLVVLSVQIEGRSALLQSMEHTTYATDFLTTVAVPLLGAGLVTRYAMPRALLQMKNVSFWQAPNRWHHIAGWHHFVATRMSAVRLDVLRNPIDDVRLLAHSLTASTSPAISYLANGTGAQRGASLWSRLVDVWSRVGAGASRVAMLPFVNAPLSLFSVLVMIVAVARMARTRRRRAGVRSSWLAADEEFVLWCVVVATASALVNVFGDGTAGLGRHNLLVSYLLIIAVISFVWTAVKWRSAALHAREATADLALGAPVGERTDSELVGATRLVDLAPKATS